MRKDEKAETEQLEGKRAKARVMELEEETVQGHLARVRPLLPDAPEASTFERRFDLITVARVAKDISHYLHAAAERGDPRYLAFVPAGLRNLKAATRRAAERDTELAAFARLVAQLPDSIHPCPGAQAGGPS